jgi:hypothetical protein
VQVVTKKESGMRCTGEARGTPGEVRESVPEVRGRAQGSVAEHKGVWQSTRERGRVQGSVAECKGVQQSMREHGRA